jgi:hypothetical protein
MLGALWPVRKVMVLAENRMTFDMKLTDTEFHWTAHTAVGEKKRSTAPLNGSEYKDHNFGDQPVLVGIISNLLISPICLLSIYPAYT